MTSSTVPARGVVRPEKFDSCTLAGRGTNCWAVFGFGIRFFSDAMAPGGELLPSMLSQRPNARKV
jgi:hypothetical protein